MGNQQQGHYDANILGVIPNPFFQGDAGTDIEVLTEFNCKSYYNDPYFKECKVLEHKSSRELIIMKDLYFEKPEQMEKHFAEFQKRKQMLTDEHLIRLRYVAKKSSKGLLGEEHRVVLLFDYLLTDLYSQITNRMKQHRTLTNEQLGTILSGAVRGFAALEKLGIPNDKIKLKNVYFGLKEQTPIVKVADSHMFAIRSNCENVRMKDPSTDDIFLSPEETKGLKEDINYYNKKSGVYTLAICLMEVCLLTSSKNMYDYKQGVINFKQVDERLNIIKNKFPLGFYCLLKEMTERSVEHRPSFVELQQKIPSNIKHFTPNMTLTLVPKTISNNNVYIKETVAHVGVPKGLIEQNPTVVANKTIVPAIIPKTSRATATLAGEFRPQVTQNLEQVNELYTNGNAYKGQKNKDGQRHGKGKYIYADGSYYYGDWFRNKMSGKGGLYYADGGVEYDGDWKDDAFHGKGIMYSRGTDWLKYQGQFYQGRIEGYGTMTYKDGSTHTGNFRNDVPHGKGRLTSRDGTVKMGTWDAGKFKQN